MKIKEIFKFDSEDRKVILLSIFFGILVHFIAIANNLYHSDGIGFNIVELGSKNFLGANFISGRWGLGLINMLLNSIGYTIKVPSACVFLAVLILSFSNVFLFRLLGIKNNVIKVIAIASTMASPSLVNTFYYAFTSHVYVLSIFFAVFSVYLLMKTEYVILPVISMVLSMSIYQANVATIVCLCIIYVFMILQKNDIESAIRKSIEAFVSFVIAFAIYFFMMLLLNNLLGYDYFFNFYGVSDSKLLPSIGAAEVFSDILNCYKYVFRLFYGESLFAYNETIYAKSLNLLLFIVSAISFVIFFIKSSAKQTAKLLSILLIFVFPIGINIIFIMTRSMVPLSESRTVYSYVYYLIFACIIIDWVLNNLNSKFIKYVFCAFAICAALVVNDKIILAHHSYYNMQKQNDDIRGFTTELATRIMSLDGFDEKKPVLCIGQPRYKTNIIYDNYIKYLFPEYHEDLNLIAAWYRDWVKVINFFAGTHFRTLPDNIDKAYYYSYHRDVESMPSYPKDGSIKIIDDIIIVKFVNLSPDE